MSGPTSRVRHVSRSIDRAPADVVRYLGDPRNLPQWASGISAGIREVGGRWLSASPMGEVEIRFAPKNDFGVLDHDVTLPNGVSVHNPMRVLPNGSGSEVVFSVFHRDGMTDDELDQDCETVAKDLEKAKSILEAR